jgi:hypothetical protein
MTTSQKPLDQILSDIDNPLDLCIEYCNTTITDETKEPFYIVVAQYYLYKTLLKAKRLYYQSLTRPKIKVTMKSFKPVKFQDFYRMLDPFVFGILLYKQPLEHICVLRNL